MIKSCGTSPAAKQVLKDASELVVKDGVDDWVEEAVDVTEPGEQRKDDRVDSTDGAAFEQVVADTDGVGDVDGEERDPAEQKHAFNRMHHIAINRSMVIRLSHPRNKIMHR